MCLTGQELQPRRICVSSEAFSVPAVIYLRLGRGKYKDVNMPTETNGVGERVGNGWTLLL